ncbi:MAG: hypothetical protein Q7S64_01925 [bacterium]|nr:hypothetical protein [bacterium]
MKISSTFHRVLSTLGIALFVGVGSAAAAPYSNVNSLPARTTADSVNLTFDYLGSGGSPVTSVDLYMSKDGGVFTLNQTTTNVNSPIVFDFKPFGDGRFSFFTIAHTQNGEVEVKSRTEATIIRDATAPAAPKTDKIFVNEGVTPDLDAVKGNIDSVERNVRVEIFSDSALKNLIAAVNATDTGEWGPVQIGDNSNSAVWIVAVDANDNRSSAARVENKIAYSRSVTNFHATTFTGDKVNLDYAGPTDSQLFVVEYKHAGGSVWSARFMTASTTPELVDLEAGRAYDVRVAPVDDRGNVGVYVGTTLRTVGKPVGPGATIVAKVAEPVPAGVGGSTASPAVPATGTTTGSDAAATADQPATDATKDQAAVDTKAKPADSKEAPKDDAAANADQAAKDAADQAAANQQPAPEEKSSATPWVILAILIILAGIATGGYFYWFAGPEEVTTTVKPEGDKEEEEKDKRW